MKYIRKIQQTTRNTTLNMPTDIVKDMGLKKGDTVEIEYINKKLIIKKK